MDAPNPAAAPVVPTTSNGGARIPALSGAGDTAPPDGRPPRRPTALMPGALEASPGDDECSPPVSTSKKSKKDKKDKKDKKERKAAAALAASMAEGGDPAASVLAETPSKKSKKDKKKKAKEGSKEDPFSESMDRFDESRDDTATTVDDSTPPGGGGSSRRSRRKRRAASVAEGDEAPREFSSPGGLPGAVPGSPIYGAVGSRGGTPAGAAEPPAASTNRGASPPLPPPPPPPAAAADRRLSLASSSGDAAPPTSVFGNVPAPTLGDDAERPASTTNALSLSGDDEALPNPSELVFMSRPDDAGSTSPAAAGSDGESHLLSTTNMNNATTTSASDGAERSLAIPADAFGNGERELAMLGELEASSVGQQASSSGAAAAGDGAATETGASVTGFSVHGVAGSKSFKQGELSTNPFTSGAFTLAVPDVDADASAAHKKGGGKKAGSRPRGVQFEAMVEGGENEAQSKAKSVGFMLGVPADNNNSSSSGGNASGSASAATMRSSKRRSRTLSVSPDARGRAWSVSAGAGAAGTDSSQSGAFASESGGDFGEFSLRAGRRGTVSAASGVPILATVRCITVDESKIDKMKSLEEVLSRQRFDNHRTRRGTTVDGVGAMSMNGHSQSAAAQSNRRATRGKSVVSAADFLGAGHDLNAASLAKSHRNRAREDANGESAAVKLAKSRRATIAAPGRRQTMGLSVTPPPAMPSTDLDLDSNDGASATVDAEDAARGAASTAVPRPGTSSSSAVPPRRNERSRSITPGIMFAPLAMGASIKVDGEASTSDPAARSGRSMSVFSPAFGMGPDSTPTASAVERTKVRVKVEEAMQLLGLGQVAGVERIDPVAVAAARIADFEADMARRDLAEIEVAQRHGFVEKCTKKQPATGGNKRSVSPGISVTPGAGAGADRDGAAQARPRATSKLAPSQSAADYKQSSMLLTPMDQAMQESSKGYFDKSVKQTVGGRFTAGRRGLPPPTPEPTHQRFKLHGTEDAAHAVLSKAAGRVDVQVQTALTNAAQAARANRPGDAIDLYATCLSADLRTRPLSESVHRAIHTCANCHIQLLRYADAAYLFHVAIDLAQRASADRTLACELATTAMIRLFEAQQYEPAIREGTRALKWAREVVGIAATSGTAAGLRRSKSTLAPTKRSAVLPPSKAMSGKRRESTATTAAKSSELELGAVHRQLGLCYSAVGNDRQAIEHLDAAIEIANRLDPKSLDAARAHRDRGRHCISQKFFADAKSILIQAVLLAEHDSGAKNHPRDVWLGYEALGDAFTGLGDAAKAQIEYEKALRLLEFASPHHPDYLLVTTKLLQATSLMRKPGASLLYCGKALRLDPTYKWLYQAKGVLHMQRGEFDLAYGAFFNALECDRNFADARFCRLVLLRRMKKAKHPAVAFLDLNAEIDNALAGCDAADTESNQHKRTELYRVMYSQHCVGRLRMPTEHLTTYEAFEKAVEGMRETDGDDAMADSSNAGFNSTLQDVLGDATKKADVTADPKSKAEHVDLNTDHVVSAKEIVRALEHELERVAALFAHDRDLRKAKYGGAKDDPSAQSTPASSLRGRDSRSPQPALASKSPQPARTPSESQASASPAPDGVALLDPSPPPLIATTTAGTGDNNAEEDLGNLVDDEFAAAAASRRSDPSTPCTPADGAAATMLPSAAVVAATEEDDGAAAAAADGGLRTCISMTLDANVGLFGETLPEPAGGDDDEEADPFAHVHAFDPTVDGAKAQALKRKAASMRKVILSSAEASDLYRYKVEIQSIQGELLPMLAMAGASDADISAVVLRDYFVNLVSEIRLVLLAALIWKPDNNIDEGSDAAGGGGGSSSNQGSPQAAAIHLSPAGFGTRVDSVIEPNQRRHSATYSGSNASPDTFGTRLESQQDLGRRRSSTNGLRRPSLSPGRRLSATGGFGEEVEAAARGGGSRSASDRRPSWVRDSEAHLNHQAYSSERTGRRLSTQRRPSTVGLPHLSSGAKKNLGLGDLPDDVEAPKLIGDDEHESVAHQFIREYATYARILGIYVAQYFNRGVTHLTVPKHLLWDNQGAWIDSYFDDPAVPFRLKSHQHFLRITSQLGVTDTDSVNGAAVRLAAMVLRETRPFLEEHVKPTPHGLKDKFRFRDSVEVDGRKLTEAERIVIGTFLSFNTNHASALGRVHAWGLLSRLHEDPDFAKKALAEYEADDGARERARKRYGEQPSGRGALEEAFVRGVFSDDSVDARREQRERRNRLEKERKERLEEERRAADDKRYSGGGTGCCIVA